MSIVCWYGERRARYVGTAIEATVKKSKERSTTLFCRALHVARGGGAVARVVSLAVLIDPCSDLFHYFVSYYYVNNNKK